ncbi:hypothetical protein NSK_001031 [Nannochloropsis salina CCMP1776]|uniref:Uncharacterized protein n=1 Tax=Nannochloropsis salina CCMP1776 TaxID=1027361 RepID=A0A4D9D7J3_9STRA|nr:hypothetical protein NSK_001031 [Nannochloropsis salina CCMP1776]|eukprot:TFJ87681.1 hypothetical protein NSK_001031 [Nannochloropsis salina CCMP1776]
MPATPEEIQEKLSKDLDDLITPEDEAPGDRHHRNGPRREDRGGRAFRGGGRGREGGRGNAQPFIREAIGRGRRMRGSFGRGTGGRGGDPPYSYTVVGGPGWQRPGDGFGHEGPVLDFGHPSAFAPHPLMHPMPPGFVEFRNAALPGGRGRPPWQDGAPRRPPAQPGQQFVVRSAPGPRKPGSVRLFYVWSADGKELRVEHQHQELLLITAAGTLRLNAGGRPRSRETLLGLNVVVSLLGMEVVEEGGAEEGQAQGLWRVRKGSWSQAFAEGMTVSAFASREWPKIQALLTRLPRDVTREDIVLVPPPPVPTGPGLLGKREAGEGGGAAAVRGGRGRGRGRGVNRWAGSNKWVRTEDASNVC